MALAIARAPERWRSGLLMLVMLPFWTGFLLRITAWIGLLRDDGWINLALQAVGAAAAPAALHRLRDVCRHRLRLPAVHGAAALRAAVAARPGARTGGGGSRRDAVDSVPHRHPAALAARRGGRAGAGVHPGGRRIRHPRTARRPQRQTIGRALWNEFFANHDWPMASALADAMLHRAAAPDGACCGRAEDEAAAGSSPPACCSATRSCTCRSCCWWRPASTDRG